VDLFLELTSNVEIRDVSVNEVGIFANAKERGYSRILFSSDLHGSILEVPDGASEI
jgi:hypothetical protein